MRNKRALFGFFLLGPALGLGACGLPSDPSLKNTDAQEYATPTQTEPSPHLNTEANSPNSESMSDAGLNQSVCPANMVVVSGQYCLTPEHHCLDEDEGNAGAKEGPGHCLHYAEPVTCFEARRKAMRFCMDIYEWPNQKGAMPMVLVSWEDAKELCASVDKRLCTDEEFNFACEGEQMRPFVYGYARDTQKCNFDRPYRERKFTFLSWAMCTMDPDCREAFAAIDQRMPSGNMSECRSDDGVMDLNGNVNEWVFLPQNKAPRRSGIKGGWWGPVRNRCRPTVTFHDEGDFGYEVGFRCCADPK
jgi:formylglycine-generating enzyme